MGKQQQQQQQLLQRNNTSSEDNNDDYKNNNHNKDNNNKNKNDSWNDKKNNHRQIMLDLWINFSSLSELFAELHNNVVDFGSILVHCGNYLPSCNFKICSILHQFLVGGIRQSKVPALGQFTDISLQYKVMAVPQNDAYLHIVMVRQFTID